MKRAEVTTGGRVTVGGIMAKQIGIEEEEMEEEGTEKVLDLERIEIVPLGHGNGVTEGIAMDIREEEEEDSILVDKIMVTEVLLHLQDGEEEHRVTQSTEVGDIEAGGKTHIILVVTVQPRVVGDTVIVWFWGKAMEGNLRLSSLSIFLHCFSSNRC